MDFEKICNGFIIEQVFFDCSYPMLFSVRDKENKLYLTVCCQNNREGVRWLLKETEPSIIIGMLKDEITLRDSFLKGSGKQISYFYNYKKTRFLENDKQEWDPVESIYLPDAGEFIEAEDGEFDEEIAFYQEKIFPDPYKGPESLEKLLIYCVKEDLKKGPMENYASLKEISLSAAAVKYSSLFRISSSENDKDNKLKVEAA